MCCIDCHFVQSFCSADAIAYAIAYPSNWCVYACIDLSVDPIFIFIFTKAVSKPSTFSTYDRPCKVFREIIVLLHRNIEKYLRCCEFVNCFMCKALRKNCRSFAYQYKNSRAYIDLIWFRNKNPE